MRQADTIRQPTAVRGRFTLSPFAAFLLAGAFSVAWASPCPAATPAEVDAAIRKGVAWLWSQQKPGGSWEATAASPPPPGNNSDHTWGGYTALATYALLSAGERHQDVRAVSAIDFLKRAEIVGTYSLAMRCQVWYVLPQTAETRRLLREDAARLQAGLGREGRAAGMWDYFSRPPPQPRGDRFDHSVSQFGVLGLWACAQGGVTIPPAVWRSADRAWRLHQYPSGGWTYLGEGKDEQIPAVSMTAAGVASLFITRDMIGPPAGSLCSGNVVDPGIEKGLAWLAANHAGNEDAYSFYALERIAAAGGLKHFGDFDWFAAGTDWFVRRQEPNGSWSTNGNAATPVSDTAFALLFLSHGRAPVLINKLDYETRVASATPATRSATAPAAGPGTDVTVVYTWNQRPRDAANLVQFMRGRLETYLNWQTVPLDGPADELNDAAILYISGNKPLALPPEGEAKLQRFVRQGGLILANPDCPTGDDDPFTRSVVALGERLFGGKFRPLPATHPLLAEQLYRSDRWKTPPAVLGLSNGVRELVLLCPAADPGKAWQRNDLKADAAAFELGTNVCLYAADKQSFALKGQSHLVRATAPGTRTVRVARLKAGDNWDPEPGGWWRLDAVLRNGFGVALTTVPVPPDANNLTDYAVAHLTGTTPFTLTAAQRRELTRFVTGGGTLVIDAAGGSPAFADAAEKELAATFGGTGDVLPPGDALYTLPQSPLPKVEYRSYLRRKTTGRLNVPRVRGIKVGGRIAVYFSREDLSGGLVGQPVDGILGYTPESATAIMRNVILLAGGSK